MAKDRDPLFSGRIILEKQRIDRGGYINGGRMYVGVGEPIWRYYDEDMDVHGYVRGSNRKDAVSKLRAYFPRASFR